MQRVVDLLVDVAAIEAGRVRPEPQPTALGPFLNDRLADWRRRYPERATDFKRRLGRGVPKVVIDRVWMGKALDEFADNAVKHTPAGTPITVFASGGDMGHVLLGVRDAGPGIDPAAQDEIFTDFAQADGSVTRTVGGLGLGLAFVRRIAEMFDTEVAVASRPGRGAEFMLGVPAVPPDVAPRRRPRVGGSTRRRGTRPASVRNRQRRTGETDPE